MIPVRLSVLVGGIVFIKFPLRNGYLASVHILQKGYFYHKTASPSVQLGLVIFPFLLGFTFEYEFRNIANCSLFA